MTCVAALAAFQALPAARGWNGLPAFSAGGPAAVATARAVRPDLIFLDLGLPGMSGLEVARRLRDEAGPGSRGPRIVALSGRGGDDEVRRSRQAGCDDPLVKPVDSSRLLAAIASAARG